jgi:hypothetical protein
VGYTSISSDWQGNILETDLRSWMYQARNVQESGWQPRWFRKGKGKDTYEYVGGYWEAREKGRWDGCPDIFGPESQENGPTE